MDFQKNYNLRSRNIVVDSPKKALEGQTSTSHPTKNMQREEVQKKTIGKELLKDTPSKEKDLPKENISKEKDLKKDEVKKYLLPPLACKVKYQ